MSKYWSVPWFRKRKTLDPYEQIDLLEPKSLEQDVALAAFLHLGEELTRYTGSFPPRPTWPSTSIFDLTPKEVWTKERKTGLGTRTFDMKERMESGIPLKPTTPVQMHHLASLDYLEKKAVNGTFEDLMILGVQFKKNKKTKDLLDRIDKWKTTTWVKMHSDGSYDVLTDYEPPDDV